MTVLIQGAGDLASGIALRLYRAGYQVVMTEQPQPLAVRWTVSFCPAVQAGQAVVEGVLARKVESIKQMQTAFEAGEIPLWIDPDLTQLPHIQPQALIEATLRKRNTGLKRGMAAWTIGIGPGFTAGQDCDAVVETMRGHHLGRVYYHGSALPNTGVPGPVGGYTHERLLRAPASGLFQPCAQIGTQVQAGQVLAWVGDQPMKAQISGILRGLLQPGLRVEAGLKAGDIDPRCEISHCYTVSDKATAIGGGVLEALLAGGILPSSNQMRGQRATMNRSQEGFHGN